MSLASSFGALVLLTFAAWGIGDALLIRIAGQRLRAFGTTSYALAIVFGFGVIGQAGFIVGLIPGTYRASIIVTVISGLAVYAIVHLRAVRGDLRVVPRDFGFNLFVLVVCGVAIWYLARWIRVLAGFPDGSDVFSHHFSHAKIMLNLHRFAYDVRFPDGEDHISNYNPALVHILYVITRAMGGTRTGNLFHWLNDALLLLVLYGTARIIRNRFAGAFAVALYLSMYLVAMFALDVSDYVLFASFFIAAVLLLVLSARTNDQPLLIAAACNAGFALSSKYYALILVPFLALIPLSLNRTEIRRRILAVATFGVIATAIYAPWPIYFAIRFHDPIYPFLRGGPWVTLFKATTPIALLSRFMSPADHSLVGPALRYVTALIFPIMPSFAVWTLTPLFIPGFLLVAGYIVVKPIRNEGAILGALSITALIVMGIVFGDGSVKWTYFPSLAFCVALAICVADWRPPARFLACLVVLVVAAAQYFTFGGDMLASADHGTRWKEEERWTPLARYFNAHVEQNGVVAGIDYFTKYYLRDDIKTIEGQESICDDWSKEENLIRREHARYYVVDDNDRKAAEGSYELFIARWEQVGRGQSAKAEYLRTFLQRYRARTAARDRFLQQHGQILTTIGSARVYELR